MRRLYVLGDSISLQYGPHLARALAGRMRYGRKTLEEAEALGLGSQPGANGGDSSMVLAFLGARREAGGLEADVLLLNCGLHDIKTPPGGGPRQVSLEDYHRNLAAILGHAQAMGLAVVWVRTTPSVDAIHNRPGMQVHRFAADVDAYNEVADAVMAGSGVPSIDLHGFTLSLGLPDEELYADHVHFTEDVRRLQAAHIAGWLLGRESARTAR